MPKKLLSRALLLALLWWLLAEGHGAGWLLPLAGILLALWASVRLLPADVQRPLFSRPRSWLRFIGFFVWNSLRAGAQVARLAFAPRANLQPAMVEFETMLPPGAPRLLLLGTLSLMPGTLGARIEDARLRLHVLDQRVPVVDEARRVEAVVHELFGANR